MTTKFERVQKLMVAADKTNDEGQKALLLEQARRIYPDGDAMVWFFLGLVVIAFVVIVLTGINIPPVDYSACPHCP